VIASVSGRVAAVAPDGAVVEVGGIGLSVQCTPGTLATLRTGATARLATSLVVREDSLTLYGFVDDDERSLFELLQTASGVGPRLAQAMLAVYSPAELRRAVSTEDIRALTRVPGIGKKGAERLVLELRDRLGPVSSSEYASAAAANSAAGSGWRDQVREAVIGLGWSAKEAEEAIAAVAEEARAANGAAGTDGAPRTPGEARGLGTAGSGEDVAALLKSAIRRLGRR
jgi:Holliday junction DNA helicase RuvA